MTADGNVFSPHPDDTHAPSSYRSVEPSSIDAYRGALSCDVSPGCRRPNGSSDGGYRIFADSLPADELDLDGHYVLFHQNRIIALAGLTRELYSAVLELVRLGFGECDSQVVEEVVRSRHGADSLDQESVAVAMRELLNQSLVTARDYEGGWNE